MARGTPDGGYGNYQVSGNQQDAGALGDRIMMGGGSGIKLGRVVWATGFEGEATGALPTEFLITTLSTKSGVQLGGSAAVWGGEPAWQGNNLLQLATLQTINDVSSIYKGIPIGAGTMRVGYELMADVAEIGGLATFDISFPGTLRLTFNASGAPNGLQVYSFGAGAFVNVPGFNSSIIGNGVGNYNNIKVVEDLSTGYFVKAYINNVVFDLSSYKFAAGAAAPGTVLGTVTLKNLAALPGGTFTIVMLDNIILTADEP